MSNHHQNYYSVPPIIVPIIRILLYNYKIVLTDCEITFGNVTLLSSTRHEHNKSISQYINITILMSTPEVSVMGHNSENHIQDLIIHMETMADQYQVSVEHSAHSSPAVATTCSSVAVHYYQAHR